jgi:hypothetical protein
MGFRDEDYGGRIINYILRGEVGRIGGLFEMGFLNKWDRLDLTGHYRHTETDAVSLLHVVACKGSSRANEMIDVLLANGCDINEIDNESTPVETAIAYHNFDVAAYLLSKGGKYDKNNVAAYNTVGDIDLFVALTDAIQRVGASQNLRAV